MKVEAGYALLTSNNDNFEEGFRINIVNLSHRTVIISNIKLYKGRGKKKKWVFVYNWENAREIKSGYDAQIVLKYHDDLQWKQGLINRLELTDDGSLETLHLRIETATGHIKKVKLNQEFIDDMRHEIEMLEIDRSKIE